MKMFRRNRKRRRGVLTFEWLLIITVVVIGIVGGLAVVRNAIIDELCDMALAIDALYEPPAPPSP